ncbi:hypothetical protein J7L01_07170 [bacterium]|nr:hypothetical protein [bacterium]
MRNSILITSIAVSICIIGCSRENPSVNARKCAELVVGHKYSEMPEGMGQLHWTMFDSLAVVAERENPDSAMAIFRDFYSKKSETTKITTARGLDQLLALNLFALQSCDSGAIYIPNGDNDFYPALFLQKVEGKRRDILILHNSFLKLREFREIFADDRRINALFDRDEWLAGPPDSLDPIHWVALRAIEKGEDSPPVHFATMCRPNLPQESYYQQGITFKIGAPPDPIEWARLNGRLLKDKFPAKPFEEGWEPRIQKWGWCLMPFSLGGRCVMALKDNEHKEEAAALFHDLSPALGGIDRWWLFGFDIAEDIPLGTEFLIDGTKKHLENVGEDSTGFDKRLAEIVAEKTEKQ